MIQEDIDLVAGGLKGASWRHKLGADQQYDSTLEDAFECATFLEPPGASPLWAALLMSGSRRVRHAHELPETLAHSQTRRV